MNGLKKIKTQIYEMSDAKKSAIAYLFASFIQQGVAFLITPFFTRLMSTSDFGMVSVYNSWVEMIMPAATLTMFSGFYSVAMVDYEDRRSELTTSLVALSNIVTVIVMTVFAIVAVIFRDYIQLSTNLIILMTVYFIFYPATRYWMARERFEYKYKVLTLTTIASGVLSPIVGIICVITVQVNKGLARLYGSNSVIILFGVVFYIVILRRYRKVNTTYWKNALAFSIPLLPHYLAMHILAASDKVMIQNFYSSSEAAIYGIAYTASMVITIAWTAINGSLTPHVMDCLKHDKLEKIEKATLPCIIGFSVLCLIVVLLAPEVIYILGGSKYADSVKLIPPLIAAVLFMEMYNIFSIVEFYHKRTKMIMVATIAAAILNIALNLVCIPMFGYYAAAYTTLVCYMAYCFFHYINMKHIEKRNIYNGKILLVLSGIYIALCLSALLIYDYAIIRYLIILVAAIVCIVFRNKLIIIYKRIIKK